MGANQGTLQGHNINNYYIGKGILSIKLAGESVYTDCGNAPVFEILPKPKILDHFSSRTGVKKKDFSATIEQEATLTVNLEEFNARNLAMALMGSLLDSPAEHAHINILSQGTINGAIKFVGDNDIGPQWTVIFPSVNFTPGKAISFIGDTWGACELSGDVLADHLGVFGTATAVLDDTMVA